jgi:uncharacterized coiled-coil protein SlyX
MEDIKSFQNSMDELQDRVIEVERRTRGDDITHATSQIISRIESIDDSITELQHATTSVEQTLDYHVNKRFDDCDKLRNFENCVDSTCHRINDRIDDLNMKQEDDMYECNKQIAKVADDLQDFVNSSEDYKIKVQSMLDEANDHLFQFSTKTCDKMEQAADAVNVINVRLEDAKRSRQTIWRNVNDFTEIIDDLTLKVSKNTLEITSIEGISDRVRIIDDPNTGKLRTIEDRIHLHDNDLKTVSDDVLNVRKLVEFVDDRDYRMTGCNMKRIDAVLDRINSLEKQVSLQASTIETLEKRIKDLEPKDDWETIQS